MVDYGTWYLLLLVRSSVPRLQKRVGLGAARGLHSIFTWPPRAAGTSFLTGFSLKSGAWTENQNRWTGQNKRGIKGRKEKRDYTVWEKGELSYNTVITITFMTRLGVWLDGQNRICNRYSKGLENSRRLMFTTFVSIVGLNYISILCVVSEYRYADQVCQIIWINWICK